MKRSSIIILAVVGLLVLWAISVRNGLVSSDLEVQKVWSNVEADYQRRTDLYNSVIKVIEGSANFEKNTLKEVIEARAKATQIQVDINDPETLAKYQAAQSQLQGAFSRLMAVAESYPDLKTTKEFQDFQTQIEGTENRIKNARRDYNESVNNYNLKVRTFPRNIIASIFGFKTKNFYKADPGSENAPDIKFNIK